MTMSYRNEVRPFPTTSAAWYAPRVLPFTPKLLIFALTLGCASVPSPPAPSHESEDLFGMISPDWMQYRGSAHVDDIGSPILVAIGQADDADQHSLNGVVT